MSQKRVRVGLVLGAGGVQGGAWLTGGLDALAGETGWDPAGADFIVGTSAGSMVAALCASGVPPWFMVAHSRGEVFTGVRDAQGRPSEQADRTGGAAFSLHRGIPRPGPGSWSLIAGSLRRPARYRPAAALSAWLPRGLISTEPLKEQVRRVVPSGWSPHPNLWVVACDYGSGERVAFGRSDAPKAEHADAVAASCAIPGFYRPVKIDGRDYVDGGIYSTSNMDLLRDAGLDLVICLNPTSTLHPIRALNPAAAARLVMQRASGRRLGSEAKRLRAHGTEVVMVQPLPDDLEAMGPNLMSRRNRNEVIEVARRTVTEQLRLPEHRQLLAELPAAARPEKVRRPDGPSEEWPTLGALQNPG